jgi:hypothetical protein
MARIVNSPPLAELEIDGHLPTRAGKNVRRWRFGRCCKALWDKPDTALAAIGGVDTRTARRWMRGDQMPPWAVIRAYLDRSFEPIT